MDYQRHMRRDMTPTRTWPLAVLALALAAFACTGAGGTGPFSDGAPKVRLTTSLETVYYNVEGRTTKEIFNSVEANGPELEGLTEGKFASGLTEDESSFKWEFLQYTAYCELESVDIRVNLVMTLPEHADPDALSAGQSARWRTFAEEVAAHEQRHVDIHLERMASFKTTIETFPARFSDCDTLGSVIELAWDVERDFDDQQQEAFHRSEEELTQRVTQPLQEQVDINQGELARLERMRSQQSVETGELKSAVAEIEERAEPFMQGMESIRRSYPGLALPPDVYDRFQRLLSEWNGLNDQRNTLVEEINRLVALHNQTVGEINRLVEETNRLLEDLAWLS